MYGGPNVTKLFIKTAQPGADVFSKNECEAWGSTVTRDKVEAVGRGDQDQDIGEGREKQGMHGRPSKD